MESENTLREPSFVCRHTGPSENDITAMLRHLGFNSLDEFSAAVVPPGIGMTGEFSLTKFSEGLSEREVLQRLREIAGKNAVFQSYIGMGYFDTFTPPVIQRNILENPGWYTQYTPYQPEISQGRLEALLNFQTMIADLTALPVANASLLDEGTAAAEAMLLSYNVAVKSGAKRSTFLVSDDSYPQTIEVVKTRARPFGIKVVVCSADEMPKQGSDVFGALLQYPGFSGKIVDYTKCIEGLHRNGALAIVAADILALCVLKAPGEMGADVAIGNTQRFGIPMGYGGPHAAYFAVKDEYKRSMPGRLVGISKDSAGKPALRLALQTREQHIRREKATSNICTSQVLLAIMASMYAVYHGPKGLKRIAERVNGLARAFAEGLRGDGFTVVSNNFFDTVRVEVEKSTRNAVLRRANDAQVDLCPIDAEHIAVSWDEAKTEADVKKLLDIFRGRGINSTSAEVLFKMSPPGIPAECARKSEYLKQDVFNSHHSETEMLRYIKQLEGRDLSLCSSMIPLGSCTMKLNAAVEMFAISWPGFNALHPFAPLEQTKGYQELFADLEQALCDVTGFSSVSLQPNSGAQGEYAGLMTIRAYFASKGEGSRDVCLIPKSAHGTNPASSAMAGLQVIAVECDKVGSIDIDDLKAKAREYSGRLAAIMITYPSTHGVFEARVKEAASIVHAAGGQVYLDGANLNALVGLVKPAELGADVCHINLHKTFAIPHGGGGPGMGPIAAAAHLAPFLPAHPVVKVREKGEGPVSSGPWGSASILPISWAYIALMGSRGLKRATQIAILNANYIAKKLENIFPVLYKGESGLVAHECIIDLHNVKQSANVDVDDIAKRLVDFSIHAPTVSWPVPGTIMVEPTESESKKELDRFCDALIQIREEARKIETGRYHPENNPLKNAPHTLEALLSSRWERPYTREEAAYPVQSLRAGKFWPSVGRIDAAFGDKNLVVVCPVE